MISVFHFMRNHHRMSNDTEIISELFQNSLISRVTTFEVLVL